MSATAQVVDKRQMTDRMVDLSIASPALNAKVNVRLLLPPGWPRQLDRNWPVLYLLHGCCYRDTYAGWTNRTDVASLTSGTEVLVVMPEAGRAGYYSDWWNHGKGGAPAWETFHINELLPILHRDYRAGDALAIAGLSTGGLGAMAYAARHPDKFQAAASYSGDLYTLRSPWITQSRWARRLSLRKRRPVAALILVSGNAGRASALGRPKPREEPDVIWEDRAACEGMERLFFGRDGEPRLERKIRETKAQTVCMSCPMRVRCLNYALRNSIRHGIWGGLNYEDRVRERRLRNRRADVA